VEEGVGLAHGREGVFDTGCCQGYVVAASTDKCVYCLKGGKLVWKFETLKPDVAGAVISDWCRVYRRL